MNNFFTQSKYFAHQCKHFALTAAVAAGMMGISAPVFAHGYEHTGMLGQEHSIRSVQRELRASGLYTGRIDGIDGPATQQAIRRFQRQNNLPVTGLLNHQTRQQLRFQRSGYFRSQPAWGQANMQQNSGTMHYGRSIATVESVQQQLKQQGFYSGAIDGINGPMTQSALRQYQRTNNLAVTGALDHQTLAQLGIVNPNQQQAHTSQPSNQPPDNSQVNNGTNNPSAAYSQNGNPYPSSAVTAPPSFATVQSAQRQLRQDGFYHEKINGAMNSQTRTAIRQYQANNNLTANGQLDQNTLNSLGISGEVSSR